MITPNRHNSDFQIAYLLAGRLHSPDAAYAMLCNLREGRELALAEAEPELKRLRSAAVTTGLRGALNRLLRRDSTAAKVFLKNYAAAQAELHTIARCIERVQPLRAYRALPDAEAHEACQRDEWRLEFIERAENSLLATGYLSAELLSDMRAHPDFMSHIWPAVENIKKLIVSGEAHKLLEPKHGSIGFLDAICPDKNSL